MTSFADSYLGRLRTKVGSDLVLMPGAQVAVIDDAGRLLVQRRTDDGEWELPSGASEPGQNFVDTARIELAEEAGLRFDVEQFEPFASASHPTHQLLHYPNGDVVHAFALCFLVRLDPPATRAARSSIDAARTDGEATDHQWVPIDRLPSPFSASGGYVVDLLRVHLATGMFQAG